MFQGAQRWRTQTSRTSGLGTRPPLIKDAPAEPEDLGELTLGAPKKKKLRPLFIVLLLLAVLAVALFVFMSQPKGTRMTVVSGGQTEAAVASADNGATGGGGGAVGDGGGAGGGSGVADGTAGSGGEKTDGTGPGTDAADAGSAAKDQSGASLRVYISGAVNAPGVIELSAGARLIDAVALCGGLSDEAAADFVNLAAPVEDGMHIHIPHLSEVEGQTPPAGASSGLGTALQTGSAGGEAASSGTGGAGAAGTSGTAASTGGSSASSASPGLVDINNADQATLETLPGIGPVTAQRIIAYRTANGPFKQPSDLKKVSGIGDARFADVQPYVVCH